MNLKFIPQTEKLVKVSISLESSFKEQLESYVKYVKSSTGQELKVGDVAASMVKTFITGDKKFAKWLKDQATTAKESVQLEGSVQQATATY